MESEPLNPDQPLRLDAALPYKDSESEKVVCMFTIINNDTYDGFVIELATSDGYTTNHRINVDSRANGVVFAAIADYLRNHKLES